MSKNNAKMVAENPQRVTGTISIKPYIDPNSKNFGLEKYDMVVYEGVAHEEQLAFIEVNGIKRYLTGLNEYAPEVVGIQDPEEKEAKIKEIRNVVSKLEMQLAVNIVKPDDPEFWNKVKLLKPDNDEFWSKVFLRCGNKPLALDPVKNPHDLIKIYAIEAGGFNIVAKSLEDAESRSRAPKFYLDKFIETVSVKTEGKKIRNRALSELQKVFDTNSNKLFYIAKTVDPNSVQYKKSTPNDVIYENMDNYINGRGVDSERTASEKFLAVAGQDMETLKIRSIIKDSTYYKLIVAKSDGFIYHLDSSTMMGRNSSDCLEFLKNPLNDKILGDLTSKVEKYWNQ